jgi:His-Xaa-Ser system protein HxsD
LIDPARAEYRPFAFTHDGSAVALEFDAAIYSPSALLRAGYKLSDRAYVHLARDESSGKLVMNLIPRDAGADLGALAGELTNEALDQRLRELIAAETGAVRELIFAQAFSEGNLLDPNRDDGDYEGDPLGLAAAR